MSRVERKPRSRKPTSQRKSAGGTLLGMFVGLVVGLLIAAAVAWYIKGVPAPFQSVPRGDRPVVAPGTAPEQLPAKPGDEASQPKYDFYNILPGKADTPAAAPAEPAKQAASPSPAGKDEALYLQAGAFTSPQDADNLKAKLALMGVEALVSPTDVPDKGTLYRVRIGPYEKPEELSSVRADLAKAGVRASVVKGGK